MPQISPASYSRLGSSSIMRLSRPPFSWRSRFSLVCGGSLRIFSCISRTEAFGVRLKNSSIAESFAMPRSSRGCCAVSSSSESTTLSHFEYESDGIRTLDASSGPRCVVLAVTYSEY